MTGVDVSRFTNGARCLLKGISHLLCGGWSYLWLVVLTSQNKKRKRRESFLLYFSKKDFCFFQFSKKKRYMQFFLQFLSPE
jgi:hypothetical protein